MANKKKSLAVRQSGAKRKLAAIMFTDMVGYTALGQKNESLSLALVNEQRRLLRPIFKRHRGREIKTIGDAFLVEFQSALDATRCAYDIQRAIREFNISLSEDKRLTLRVGVHVGDVVESKSGDISGDAVNVASRIEPLAEHGGVCITRQVYDHVQNKFELPLESLGMKSLKNVQSPVQVYKMVMPWERQEKRSSDQITERVNLVTDLDPLRIAVLPFSSMSPDPNDEYFADGITEELISKISLVRELSVISRTSVTSFKKAHGKKMIDIGRELKVGTILEGSVRKVANRVRISAQLIDVQSDKHLWAENYDRSLEDVFAIQSEISQTVADALRIRLLKQEKERIQKPPTTDLEAYTLYMQGLFQYNKTTKEGYTDALQYFEQATRKDPQFALAYSWMARAYSFLSFFGLSPSSKAYPKAREFAQKALEIDELLPEAHISLGSVLYFYDWNFTGAEAEYRRAIELNPSLALAHTSIAFALLYQLRNIEEVTAEARRALELDPLSASNLTRVGRLFLYTGRYDDAIEILSRALKIDSNVTLAKDNLGLAYVQTGRFEIGISLIEEANRMSGGNDPLQRNDLAYAYAKAGMVDRAKRVLSELLEMERENPTSGYAIASVYSNLGETDKAYDWLGKACNERLGILRGIKTDFAFDNIRSDPRYLGLLERIGLMLPEEKFQRTQTTQMIFDKKRIAILPFANISPDPNDEYFADGMTEELINVLSQIQELRVIARTSVNHYKKTDKALSQIAQELNVGTILEGSVRKAGNKVRATVQLIDAQSQEHEWSQNYDRGLDDIFQIQSDIAKHVAENLKVKILGAQQARIEKKETENNDAYLAYLKGRALLHSRDEKALRAAKEQFELALSLDHKFARAYSGLADALYLLGGYMYDSIGESTKRAKSLAQRALELDPNLAEAHASLGVILQHENYTAGAEQEYKLAIKLNPSYSSTYQFYGNLLAVCERFEEMYQQFVLAEEADPLSDIVLDNVQLGLMVMGRIQEGKAKLDKLGTLAPNGFLYLRDALEYCLYVKPDLEKAREQIMNLEQIIGKERALEYWMNYYAVTKEEDQIKEIIIKLKELPEVHHWRNASLAYAYAALGDMDTCLSLLESYIELSPGIVRNMKLYARFEPISRAIVNDPKWKELLTRKNIAL